MSTITLSFAGVPDLNPRPAPAGFTSVGAGTANTTGSQWRGNSASLNTVWRCDTQPAVDLFTASFIAGASNTNGRGIAVANSLGNGFMFLVRSTDIRIFALASWALSGSALGAPDSITLTDNDTISVDVTQSTGTYVVKQNGTTRGTYVNTLYTSGLFSGLLSRSGAIRSFTQDFIDAQIITSINSGNPVTVGQSNVVIAHTGFSGAVTSVTTNRAGVTAAIVSGDASSTTINLSGWTEGGQYPVAPIDVTYTLTRGAESASGTQSLIRPASYAQVTFVGAITDDVNQIGYGLAQAGHVVEGGAFYYRTDQVPTLTVNADTSWTSDPAGGTFDAVFIPVSGATSGRAYLFDITLLNGEIVSIVGGLTSVGATSIGLTSSGLTSVGL